MDINNSSFWHNISNLYKDMQGNEASPENNNSHPGTQGQPHNDFDDSLVFQLFDSPDIDHDSFSKQVIDFFEENYQGYNWQDSYPANEDVSPQAEKPQENTRSQAPSSPIASGKKTATVPPDNSYISTMAEIAGVSFGEAANITKRHDFNNPRISMDKMLNILRDDFKLNATKATTDGWSSLPDIALVEIKAPEKDHKNHAVVVKRHDNNQQYFYDNRFPEPMEKSHQKLINAEYIGIQPGQHSPKDSAPLSTPTQETPKQEAPTPEAPKSNASASTHEVNKPRSRQHKNYVSVIAEMAGVSYEQAAKVAQNYKRSSQGMSMNRILKALREGLHINAARMTASNFSKLADVALVEIEGSKNGKDHHLAIVRRHKNGQQYIHDKPNSDAIKVSDQKLLSQEYIGLKPSQRKHTKQANTEGIDNNSGTPTKTTQGNSSRKINKVINFAEPMPPKGHIAAVAEMAGVSYERAERVAARYGMSGQDMEMNTMLKTLRDGFKMDVTKMSAANWSELPDVAIVDIIAPEEESKTHSVVARRNSSGEHFLYDNRVVEPVKLSDQKLAMEDCIGIQAKKQQSNHQASLSAPVSNAAQQKSHTPKKLYCSTCRDD